MNFPIAWFLRSALEQNEAISSVAPKIWLIQHEPMRESTSVNNFGNIGINVNKIYNIDNVNIFNNVNPPQERRARSS